MDDKKNSEYSRAPELEDLISLCRSLNEQGVKYVLIGGFAVILHGYVRGTKDIDLLVDASPDNIKKVKKTLSTLPDNLASLIQDDEVQKYSVVRVADEFVIDLMAQAGGIDFDQASQSIEYVTIKGVKIPLATKELLIQMKDTIRPSDKADVQFLKIALEDEGKK